MTTQQEVAARQEKARQRILALWKLHGEDEWEQEDDNEGREDTSGEDN